MTVIIVLTELKKYINDIENHKNIAEDLPNLFTDTCSGMHINALGHAKYNQFFFFFLTSGKTERQMNAPCT